MSRIANNGCIPKVFDFKELVVLCASNFDSKHQLIKLNKSGRSPIPLNPNTFRRMLRLPTPTRVLKLSKADSFLDSRGSRMSFLKVFLVQPPIRPISPSHINVCMLAQLYREFTWLFACLVGKNSTAYVPRYVLYILHYSIRVGVILNWA